MLAACLAAALAFTPADAKLALDAAGALVSECTPRDAGTVGSRRAALHIRDAARAAGADASLDFFSAMTPKGRRLFCNVSCEWTANPTGEWTVVISHFDTKPSSSCPGANDGASTTGILLSLARIISSRRTPPGNIMLMWLDGEESMSAYTEHDGFWGSKRAARLLKKSGRKVKAVVCLDMLGDRDLAVSIPRNSSPELRDLALECAGRIGASGSVSTMRELVKDDHVAFLGEGFPAIDLIDFEYGSAPGRNDWWHTPEDTMDKLSEESLLLSGRLACEMLNRLL